MLITKAVIDALKYHSDSHTTVRGAWPGATLLRTGVVLRHLALHLVTDCTQCKRHAKRKHELTHAFAG